VEEPHEFWDEYGRLNYLAASSSDPKGAEVTTDNETWEDTFDTEPPYCESHNAEPCGWCHGRWIDKHRKVKTDTAEAAARDSKPALSILTTILKKLGLGAQNK
jgi:hypothetical protein